LGGVGWLAFEIEWSRRRAEVAQAVIAHLERRRNDRNRFVGGMATQRRDLSRTIEPLQRDSCGEDCFIRALKATLAALEGVPVPDPIPRVELPWHTALRQIVCAVDVVGGARLSRSGRNMRFARAALEAIGQGAREAGAIEQLIREHCKYVRRETDEALEKWSTNVHQNSALRTSSGETARSP
jgi:hypothetical protein